MMRTIRMVVWMLVSACIADAGDADALWSAIQALEKSRLSSDATQEERIADRNKRLETHRALGMQFWSENPFDRRRYEWALATLQFVRGSLPPFSDEDSDAHWREFYTTDVRPALLSSPQVTAVQRAELLRLETLSWRTKSDQQRRAGAPAAVEEFTAALVAYATQPDAQKTWVRSFAGSLFYYLRAVDDQVAERKAILALKESGSAELRIIASGKEQVAAFRNRPLDFQWVTLDGKRVDLAELRGKVVLVDVWSLFCSSCIAAMPKIRVVYDEYRQHGFEVVGLCLMRDEAVERPKVLTALEKTGGAAWTNCFVAGETQKTFAEQHGITGVPVTWLFDQNGLLVTSDVHGPRLESEVRRLLGMPPLVSQSGTPNVARKTE